MYKLTIWGYVPYLEEPEKGRWLPMSDVSILVTESHMPYMECVTLENEWNKEKKKCWTPISLDYVIFNWAKGKEKELGVQLFDKEKLYFSFSLSR